MSLKNLVEFFDSDMLQLSELTLGIRAARFRSHLVGAIGWGARRRRGRDDAQAPAGRRQVEPASWFECPKSRRKPNGSAYL